MINHETDRPARITFRERLAAKIEAFHGSHNQKTHGNRVGRIIEGLREPESGSTETRDGETVTEGIPVGGHYIKGKAIPASEFFSGEPGKEKGREIYRKWLRSKAVQDALDKPNAAVGRYHSGDSGHIFLDVVEVFPSSQLKEAMTQGRKNGEESVYDIGTGKLHKTGGTGGVGDG